MKNAVNEAEVIVSSYLDLFRKNVKEITDKTFDNMKSYQQYWSENLDGYKEKAIEKHVNLKPCLNGTETELTELLTIYTRRMRICTFGLMDIAEQYGRVINETVRIY